MGKPGYSLGTFDVGRNTYSIRVSDHARVRMAQRRVTDDNIQEIIYALGYETIVEMINSQDEFMILDDYLGYAVVFASHMRTLIVKTVIDKVHVVRTTGTRTFRLK